jgi:hypothetical protein
MADKKTTTVAQLLRTLVPEGEVRQRARKLGVFQRKGKVDVYELLLATVLLVCGRSGQSISGLRRGFARWFGVELVRSSFWDRFTEPFEKLVGWLLARLEGAAFLERPKLSGALAHFRDVIAVDSTVIKVHDKLASIWRGTRASRAAAVKIHTFVRATTGALLRHVLTQEAHGDSREFRIGHWAKGVLFLFDRAYSSASLWWRVDRLGGYFVTRLPASYRPVVKAVNRKHRGRARGLVGRPLREAMKGLQRSVVDVICGFQVHTRAYGTEHGRNFEHDFRVVAIWQPSEKQYVYFVTNLSADTWSPEQIAAYYRLRQQVEVFYKTGKDRLGLDELTSSKAHIVRTLIKAALVRASIAMRAKTEAEPNLPVGRWINPVLWATVWSDALHDLFIGAPARAVRWAFLARQAADPNVNRVPHRLALVTPLGQRVATAATGGGTH